MTGIKGTRQQVMNGAADVTTGGLTKKDLKYNDAGEIVSRKLSKLAKHSDWNECTEKARKELIKEGTIPKNELTLIKRVQRGTSVQRSTMMLQSKHSC
jgi:hypothetical protein